MFIFVNREGRTLVTSTSLATSSSFRLPELDRTLNALVTSTTVIPRPVVQPQGTLGGVNYINVFGEDPLHIQLQGIVVGQGCHDLRGVRSALGVAIAFYADHGVVNRLLPLDYTITGQPTRKAFLLGLSVAQDSAFTDMANFTMELMAESLQRYRPPAINRARPAIGDVTLVGVPSGGLPGTPPRNSGIVALPPPRAPVPLTDGSVDVQRLLVSGDVSTPTLQGLVAPGLSPSFAGFAE